MGTGAFAFDSRVLIDTKPQNDLLINTHKIQLNAMPNFMQNLFMNLNNKQLNATQTSMPVGIYFIE